jgi:hypothetical protein
MGEQVERPYNPFPTAREFDMLVGQVERNQSRLNDIDDHGTRGVSGLQIQMTEIVKDMGEIKADVTKMQSDLENRIDSLRSDMEARFQAHDTRHIEDRRDQIKGRRWIIGTMIAALLVLVGIVGLLIQLLSVAPHGG